MAKPSNTNYPKLYSLVMDGMVRGDGKQRKYGVLFFFRYVNQERNLEGKKNTQNFKEQKSEKEGKEEKERD